MTPKSILRNCYRDKGCMRWKGGCNERGYPYVYDRATYERRLAASKSGKANGMKPASHVIWESEHDPVPKDRRLVLTCRNRDCLAIEHMAMMTTVEAAAFAAEAGAWDTVKHRIARVNNARKNSKLTQDLAAQIRESVLVHKQHRENVAKQFGVCPSTVNYIVRGDRWASQIPGSSIFRLAQAA